MTCMKVYIDIFFFVNFLMNLQVFQILNYWRRKPAVSARSIAGAGLGALLGVLVVILGIRTRWILWILVYAAGTSILIRFVYGKMNFRGHLPHKHSYSAEQPVRLQAITFVPVFW